MGWFAPILATVGGGSVAAGAVIVATAVAGGLSAVQSIRAGSAEASANKQAARQEQDAIRSRQIERQRDLLSALANQRAVAGAEGVAFGGSKAAIARKDILYAREDSMIDRRNTDLKVSGYKSAASNARKSGALRAGVSLLDTAKNVATMSA